jgi:Holliday junction resolvase RusA-like endonuclease
VEIHFVVVGNPSAQKRHRTYTRGKGGRPLPFARQVDPSATDKADFIAQCRQWAPDSPILKPLRLEVRFFFPRPTGHYRTGKHADEVKANAPCWPTCRPDIDNCLKLVLDALNGVFFKDDAQIVQLDCSKQYVKNQPNTEVTIWTLDAFCLTTGE